MDNKKEINNMKTPPIVSLQEWEAARQKLLVKEKELTRARDAMAAERRRMPWMAVEQKYEFDGPQSIGASQPDRLRSLVELCSRRGDVRPGI